MPKLMPFCAVRYSTSANGPDISTKLAPPYDVLDAGPKAALLARDGHNIVAVDLPVTPPKTVGPDEAYAAAGALYRQWLAEGVLTREARPGLVAYEQVYELDGKTVQRRGLFAGLGVEPFNRKGGGIFRHEMTIAGGIGDRTKLMDATQAQLSPVFGIFPDPRKFVAEKLTSYFDSTSGGDWFGTTAGDGVMHRCWWIDDAALIAELEAFFRGTDVFIADGHHRYTTALEYAQRRTGEPTDAVGGLYGGCLFVLVAAEDPGLVVLPTHRVVCGLEGVAFEEVVEALRRDGRLVVGPTVGDRGLPLEVGGSSPATGAKFGMFDPQSGATVGIDTVDDPLAGVMPDRPAVWRTLDVAVMQHLIIDGVLAPLMPDGAKPVVRYTADLEEMKRLARAEPGRVGFVMRGTPLASVMAVSRADEVMPPKSTYFYPKLATGLVVGPLG